MKLIWLRVGSDTIIGEVVDRFSVTTAINEMTLQIQNPMTMNYVNMPAPGVIAGAKPQVVLGFKLAPIPCSEIFVKDVSYAGIINAHNPIAVTYAKVKEAVIEEANSPLMVAQ